MLKFLVSHDFNNLNLKDDMCLNNKHTVIDNNYVKLLINERTICLHVVYIKNAF